tara:strand:- start:183 stop:515 length:333 start_codon:yes stop_codon:yes gene_type:complete
MARYKYLNGERVQLSTDEENSIIAKETAWDNDSANRKLEEIRLIRNTKLSQSDWQVTSAKEQGTNLSTSFKNWRQGLRDIPTTYTTESEYDELLARDDDGNLTHSVWSES